MSLKELKLHITRFLSFTQQSLLGMKGKQILLGICYKGTRDKGNQSLISESSAKLSHRMLSGQPPLTAFL